jgi:hypothetical protein
LCIYNTQGCMGGAWANRAMCVAPTSIQKCPSIVLLEALSYSFHIGAAHVFINGPFWHSWTLFFTFFSLSSFKNYNLALLVVEISTLIIVLLIFYFWSWSFCESFIYFQFHYSILIYQILYYLMWSLFFGFLVFIIDLFVKVLVVFNFII